MRRMQRPHNKLDGAAHGVLLLQAVRVWLMPPIIIL